MTHATIVRAAVTLLIVGMPLHLTAQGRVSAPVTTLSIPPLRGAARPHLQTVGAPTSGARLTATTTPVLTPTSGPTIAPSLTMPPSARPAPAATPAPAGPTATPTVTPTLDPWLSPAAGFVVTGDRLHLAVRFPPLPPPAASIARVIFMATWPTAPPGRPVIACTTTVPVTRTARTFACDWAVTRAAVPNGPVTLRVAAYDRGGRLLPGAPPARSGVVRQPIRRVVVLVQGVCSTALAGSSSANGTFSDLQALLQGPAYGYRASDILLYSYTGGTVDAAGVWQHRAYGRFDPVRHDYRTTSLSALRDDLLGPYHAVHPNTTFVLVGHSLGGLVAFAELRAQVSAPGSGPGFLSGVVTVDSPLHGVRPAEALLGVLLRRYPGIGSRLDCVTQGPATAALVSLHGDPHAASDLHRLAVGAQRRHIRIATIGNADDCVWSPDRCGGPLIGDARTQWLYAPGVRTTIFHIARPCRRLEEHCFLGTHGAVLSRADGPDALHAIATVIGPQVR